jgi:hypothetical protein
LVLVVGTLGVPITDLASYGLLVAAALVVFTGQPTTEWPPWAAAVFLAALVAVAHVVCPAPRIEEGFPVLGSRRHRACRPTSCA